MTKLSSILDQIDNGTVLLPEFQRGYVWNREQVRGLMRSLYRRYPVGALLIWETEPSVADVRAPATGSAGVKQLLLDGQQRVTTLYGVARGKPPVFFQGDPKAFAGLHFHLDHEVFEFYAPARMKGDPLWIDVTTLFQQGLEPHIRNLSANPATQGSLAKYLSRLNKLSSMLERDFHAEIITGPDKTIDQVVDIFNKVNSGGTKLSKGDLALAKICADWPAARSAMRERLAAWSTAGYTFSLDWLLRNINAVATGKALFEAMDGITPAHFQASLDQSAKYIGAFLDLVAGRLGLDHDRVFMGRYAVPVVSRLQHLDSKVLADAASQNRLLFWYIHTALWGRFTGSTETFLARDYDVAEQEGIDGLIAGLERWRGGNLTVSADDFRGFSQGSRFYPLLYLLTRVVGARDFGSGIPLQQQMLGHLATLQVHHIFPKAYLYKHGYERGEVNAVANFCFLTQQTNLAISDRQPDDYLAEVEAHHPGVLASQWIPTDPDLWRVDRYRDFLEARRELLARSANQVFADLRTATVATETPLERMVVTDVKRPDDELADVRALVEQLTALGYVEPQVDVEISDPETGRVLAVAEAYWERGLQPGLGEPVVLELDPDEANVDRMRALGYEVFTSVSSLHEYADRRSREAAGEQAKDAAISDGQAVPTESGDVPLSPGPDPEEDATPEVEDVQRLFSQAMAEVYARAKQEAGYQATYYLEMLHQHGAMETARRLLSSTTVSNGFTALWERGRLDLTVENVVLRAEFVELFNDDQREVAQRRLEDYGFKADG